MMITRKPTRIRMRMLLAAAGRCWIILSSRPTRKTFGVLASLMRLSDSAPAFGTDAWMISVRIVHGTDATMSSVIHDILPSHM